MKSQLSIAVSVAVAVATAACGGAPNANDSTTEGDPRVELRGQTATETAPHPVSAGAGRGVAEDDAGGDPSADDAGDVARADDAGDDASADDAGDDASATPESDAAPTTPESDAAATTPGSDAAPATTTAPVFAGLHAVGNRIVGADGNFVSLHGVNRSGSEFACVDGYGFFDGPTDVASIVAMKAWGINAVRVPLNEDCWLGINGVAAAYSGTLYQQAIVGYVQLLLANGMYPIVDLHWNAPGTTLATGQEPMADADHAPAFWTSAANVFKPMGSVVLELYNEPWPDNDQDTTAAWTCWRDGGSCPSVSFEVAGMQTLVNTVRATGATNLLLLGGVEYSNALSQWAAYKPTDPLGNLGAAWHVYQGNACSDSTCFDQIAAPVAATFPIVATEIGDSSCDGTYMTGVMQWLDAHDQSYAAWSWNAWGTGCSNYSLITDYTGTPNGAYGLAYQSHLTGL